MNEITRGTTPTITFTFETIEVSNISVAYLTLKQNSTDLLERDISTATVGEKSLSWTLTQAETIKIDNRYPVSVQIRYRTSDGAALASRIYTVRSHDILKEDVI